MVRSISAADTNCMKKVKEIAKNLKCSTIPSVFFYIICVWFDVLTIAFFLECMFVYKSSNLNFWVCQKLRTVWVYLNFWVVLNVSKYKIEQYPFLLMFSLGIQRYCSFFITILFPILRYCMPMTTLIKKLIQRYIDQLEKWKMANKSF